MRNRCVELCVLDTADTDTMITSALTSSSSSTHGNRNNHHQAIIEGLEGMVESYDLLVNLSLQHLSSSTNINQDSSSKLKKRNSAVEPFSSPLNNLSKLLAVNPSSTP